MSSSNQKRICLPQSGLTNVFDLTHRIFHGLGKSTKRGIKKCSKCGIYNGTRSAMCKNKECGVILKDSEEKLKVDVDAVKLLTGTEKQLYSVRVKDMGPDYRGFVQLPVLQSHSEAANVCSEVALCFVESCQNSFDNSILRCHEEEQDTSIILCAHIKSALKSQSTASPAELKNDVLHALRVGNDVKEKLYLLATEKGGCLVQRISKSIMAVKCQVSLKHPLGYLHFTFFKVKGKDYYEKYFCSCTDFVDSEPDRDNYSNREHKCIHYYACIWAIASDIKHFADFPYFHSCELTIVDNIPVGGSSIPEKELPSLSPISNISQYKFKQKNKVWKEIQKRCNC
ncbi:hypothetical protein JTB14_012287 [Gonioctena quinquepunctata]|nr:hypothetical protein JTB14_012287 [Gonioctena quinquepunctata]